jgi:hypothetical protein
MKRHLLWVVSAIVVAVIAVTATFAYVHWPQPRGTSALTGPTLDVSIAGATPANSSTTVQVFSTVPSATGYLAMPTSTLNLSNNSYDDQLFVGSPNGTGIVQSSLSPTFTSVDGAWRHLASPLTDAVSLQLYATRAVNVGTTVEVYTYYNNLPYAPDRPPAGFTASFAFPATPTFSFPASLVGAPSLSPRVLPDYKCVEPGCQPPCNPFYSWAPINETWMPNDLLPLATAQLTATNSTAGLAFAVTIAQGALNLSFNGDAGYMSSGSLSSMQMSSSPSWSGNSTGFQGASQPSYVIPSQPISTIGLANVSVAVTNSAYTYWQTGAKGCYGTPTGKTMTTDSIYGLSSSSFNFVSDTLPTFWGGVMKKMLDFHTFQNVTQKNGAPSTELYSVMESASGYSSAQSAYNQAMKALSTIAAVVGVMTTVSDVLDLIPGAGDVSTTAEAVQVLADIYGDFTAFATLFNSISFSATAKVSLEMVPFAVTSGGVSLILQFLDSTLPNDLAVGGSEYYPYMPLTYVIAGPT